MTFDSLTALETIALSDESTGARVAIAPTRGGMVTRFDVGTRPVLFLDEASLVDETKNVRGGIPVLFPSPGPLGGDTFTWRGRSGQMKQHGFARQRAWSVTSLSTMDVRLELVSDEATRAVFPWDFAATLRYALEGAKLTVATTIANRDAGPMPLALGFHPYFFVPDGEKSRARVPTHATRAWDNVSKKTIDVRTPIDLTAKEVDLHLVDHGATRAVLERGADSVVLTGDPELGRWVIWTLAGKDFVCLEPWTAPANALNNGESLLVLEPGEEKTVTFAIERA
jgi:galactose mutarotase-like enzyme